MSLRYLLESLFTILATQLVASLFINQLDSNCRVQVYMTSAFHNINMFTTLKIYIGYRRHKVLSSSNDPTFPPPLPLPQTHTHRRPEALDRQLHC